MQGANREIGVPRLRVTLLGVPHRMNCSFLWRHIEISRGLDFGWRLLLITGGLLACAF